MSFQMPSSRYILPSFVERTSYGMKESNPYNKLFEERIKATVEASSTAAAR